MAVSGTIGINLNAVDTSNAYSISDWIATFPPSIAKRLGFIDGTGASQCDLLYGKQRTVASGANDDIDLSSLTDALGNTISFAEVVGLAIFNNRYGNTANTTNLTIGAAASNPWESWISGTTKTLGPFTPGAGFAMLSPDASGLGAVSGSAEILRVANSAGAEAKYLIGIIGRSV